MSPDQDQSRNRAENQPPIASAWTRPRKERDQQPLSRERIVAEAVALLDAEGLDALSMRQLGTRLSAGATSLYRHVANRDELIELVVDHVYGEIEVPDPPAAAHWRAAVDACAHSMRAMILRHPWTATLIAEVGLSYLGPNVVRLTDRMLAVFEAAGFAPGEADLAISAVMAYVIGISISEGAWLTSLARSGLTEAQWIERLKPAVEQATRDYPRLRDAAPEPGHDPRRARDENFQYGLDRMLDGLRSRLAD